MGIMYLAATAAGKSSSNSLTPILIIAVLFGVFYLLIIRPQRNRQRRAQQMQGGVEVGKRVRTTCDGAHRLPWADDASPLSPSTR